MFRLSWFSGNKMKENELPIIKFKKRPYSLGNYTDINGVIWDINAIIYNVIYARVISLYPNYYGTADWCSQDYKVEVI